MSCELFCICFIFRCLSMNGPKLIFGFYSTKSTTIRIWAFLFFINIRFYLCPKYHIPAPQPLSSNGCLWREFLFLHCVLYGMFLHCSHIAAMFMFNMFFNLLTNMSFYANVCVLHIIMTKIIKSFQGMFPNIQLLTPKSQL